MILWPRSFKNCTADLLIGPRVSKVIGWNMCDDKGAYLACFLDTATCTMRNLQSGGCGFESQPGLLCTKVYSAFHPSGVGKWVPVIAGKAKAGMAHSDCGWSCVQVKLWDPLRTCAIPECFCSGDSLRRGAVSSVCTFTFYLCHLGCGASWGCRCWNVWVCQRGSNCNSHVRDRPLCQGIDQCHTIRAFAVTAKETRRFLRDWNFGWGKNTWDDVVEDMMPCYMTGAILHTKAWRPHVSTCDPTDKYVQHRDPDEP